MTTQSNIHEAAASPRFTVTGLTPREIVDSTSKLSEVVKGNPAYASQAALQQAVDAWANVAHDIDKESLELETARATVAAKLANRAKLVTSWKRATKKVLGAVEEVTAGSPTAIKAWGFDVATRTSIAHSTDAPTGLRATYTKSLQLVVRWDAVRGSRGYAVQLGAGSPVVWGPAIPSPRARFTPAGLTPGQEVSIRIAVQRPGGLSVWSDALSFVVR